MSPNVIAALNKQATHELRAAQSYLAMVYSSDVHHYGELAKFLHGHVVEEHAHSGTQFWRSLFR